MLSPSKLQERAKPTNLYLVEPTDKFSYQFAALRNQLNNKNILFEPILGFHDVKQKIQDKLNRNIIIINSTQLSKNEIPKQIFNVNGNQIYCFPNKFENYNILPTSKAVIDLYKKYTGLPVAPNQINLRSVKKDIQNNPNKQTYETIMIMGNRKGNPQYQNLFNVLKQQKSRIKIINRENDVMNNCKGKILLILVRQSIDSMSKFLYDNRLDRNVDLAIFGYAKGFNKGQNFAIITDDPIEIIQYLEASGTVLPGAKQKLLSSKQASRSNIYSRIQPSNNNNSNNELFVLQGAQPSFGKNQLQQQDKSPYKNNQINNNQNNDIPITSKLPKQNQNKGIKKINNNTKNHNHNNIDTIPTISDDDDHSHLPVIKTKQYNSNYQGDHRMKNIKEANSKPRMRWYLSLDENTNNSINKKPKFVIRSLDQQIDVRMPTTQVQNTNQSQNQIKSQTSIENKNKINIPQINDSSSMKKQRQNKKNQGSIQTVNKPIMNWTVNSDKNEKSSHFSEPLFTIKLKSENAPNNSNIKINSYSQPNSVPNILPQKNQVPALLPRQNIQNSSKKTMSDQYNSHISSKKQINNQLVTKIQQKYLVKNRITEVNQQNRNSNLSYQIDDNTKPIAWYNASGDIQLKKHQTQKHQDSNPTSKQSINFYGSHSTDLGNNTVNYVTNNLVTTNSVGNVNRAPRIVRADIKISPESNYHPATSKSLIGEKQQVLRVTSYDNTRSADLYVPSQSGTINNITSNNNIPTLIQPKTFPTDSSATIRSTQNYIRDNNTVNSNNNTPNYSTYSSSLNRVNNALGYMSSQNNTGTTNTYTYKGSYNSPISYTYSAQPINPTTNIIRRSVFQPNQDINTITNVNTNTNSSNNINNNGNIISNTFIDDNNKLKIKSQAEQNQIKYMANLGIDLNKYDVIQDGKGKIVYRLKTNISNKNNNNSQNINRVRSAPKPSQIVTSYHKINSNNSNAYTNPATPRQSIANVTHNVFNLNEYDQHIDQRGRKYYKVKKDSNASFSPLPNINANVNSMTNNSNNIVQQILTPTNAIRKNDQSQQIMMDSKSHTTPNTNYLQIESQYTPSNSGTEGRYSLYSPRVGNNNHQSTTNNIFNPNAYSSSQTQNSTYKNNNSNKPSNNLLFNTPQSSTQLNKYEIVNKTKISNIPLKQQHKNSGLKQQYSETRNYPHNKQSETSGFSRSSQYTESRSSSLNHKIQPRYYTADGKISSNNYHIQNEDQLERIKQQFRTLKTNNFFTNYIIDTSHPLRYEIQKLPNSQDKIVEIDNIDKIYDYILDKTLPNQYYDIGFLFVNKAAQSKINPVMDGYYLVDVHPNNPLIDIKKDRKKVNISNLKYLNLVQKLLLAPHIQHFIFYPRNSDVQMGKILNLFPSTKFQKITYQNRSELQNMLISSLRGKGRLTRTLIFVNPYNIQEIAPVLDNSLNQKNFTMICNIRDPTNERLKSLYKQIVFPSNFDFHSYGSVMSLANYDSKSQLSNTANIAQYDLNSNINQPQNYGTQNSNIPNKIFIQHPHKGLDSQIDKVFPRRFQYHYFKILSEIKQRCHDNWILLHRQADNFGQKFDRDMGTVIVMGGRKGDRIPSGSITLSNVSEFIQILQQP